MTYATFPEELKLYNDRISREDAARQERAARELLLRLDRQPGVVLADEVGMGKTFVALATAVSVLLEHEQVGPVVVMAPPSLKEKWPRDWDVFRDKCLTGSLRERFRASGAADGVEFLRLLDDPPDKRSHIVFLPHGALFRSMTDHWVKLAVIKRAFKGRSTLSEERYAFPKFAGRLLRAEYIEHRAPGLFGDLIDRPYEDWKRIIHREDLTTRNWMDDDPVPAHLAEALEAMTGGELEDVVEGLRSLPLRESDNSRDRVRDARNAIAKAMEAVWKVALRRAKFRSPLLILDEAHHVKNPATKLAHLFTIPENDSQSLGTSGSLGGKFDRMLFLTATPFQLGHTELLHVLERFEGVSWSGKRAPAITRSEYKARLVELGTKMDAAQAAALRLDRTWSRLTEDDLIGTDGATRDVEEWWRDVSANPAEGVQSQVVAQVANTRKAMAEAELLLAPWVLRYLKPAHLSDAPDVARRNLLPGASIRDGGDARNGLGISAPVLLPFLLAGRAQTLLAKSTKGRALFAEGLSSSFEAYLETRDRKDCPEEDADVDDADVSADSPELSWYLKHLDRSLPRDDRGALAAHPKVQATAERAVALWETGEKVLIFCHYVATGRALRQHISALLQAAITRLGQAQLPGASEEQIRETIDSVGERFHSNDRLRNVAAAWAGDIVDQFPPLAEHRDAIIEVVLRFVRTPSFVVRYLPLAEKNLAKAFSDAANARSADRRPLRGEIEHFCKFLAERCIDSERRDILEALDKVQTGTHFGREVTDTFDPGESRSNEGTVLLPNVRLANGKVRSETRLRLLRTFNTPLYPEILIASSVMAEGVDLHLNCRYVIHHDLCWNPSTLEQRSGRVDRIGCKAERDKKPIHLYMPYLAATQDEKMFRVVRDRERWFQVIMGENYAVDEASTDQQSKRVLLPRSLASELSLKLHP
jgi:superfamily II DNA or RNA helicase